MCDYLPMGDFKWLQACPNFREEVILNHPDDDETGYIIEVDMTYPAELHDEHNCYPLAPEKRIISTTELSTYSKDQLKSLRLN